LIDLDSLDMQAVQQGQLERFTRLVERHQSSMFRYARSRLGTWTAAEDAVQDAFLAAYQGRHSFDPAKSFKTWLWSILANVCRRAGKQRSRPTVEDRLAGCRSDSQHSGERDVEQSETRHLVAGLLERLPDEQADAIRMRYYGELTYDEISVVLGCPPATAKSRVRYGLARMAEWLKNRQELLQ
jgi:RNA polymerase sigma-70 factor (ECF subfamily)